MMELLSFVGLADYAELNASELSGGQSMLVDIGRAMMGDPKLLLLDEPVAGVAGPLAMKIFANLRKLVDDTGISVLIIEHNMDIIKCADYIIDLGPEGGDKGGYVIAEGTPEKIIKNKNSYTGLFLSKELLNK